MSHIVLRTETHLHGRSLLKLAKELDLTYPTVWGAFRRAPVSSKFIARCLLTFPHLRFDELFEAKRTPPPLLELGGEVGEGTRRGRPRKNPDAPSVQEQKAAAAEPEPTSTYDPAKVYGFPTSWDEALEHVGHHPAGSGGELTAADYRSEGTDSLPVPHVELLLDDSKWLCRFFEDRSIQVNTDASPGFLVPLLRAYDLTEMPGSGLIRP